MNAMTIPQQPPEPEIPVPNEPGTEIGPDVPSIEPPTEYPETDEPGYEAPGMPENPGDPGVRMR